VKAGMPRPSPAAARSGPDTPVVAFCRISDHEIRAHEPIASPDALIIQDPTLLHQVDVFSGLSEAGYLLINSSHSFSVAYDNCYGVCPDNAVVNVEPGVAYGYAIDLDYCQGCGMCVEECPCGALEMVPETI
jgi:Pyruvate/2-oxoacid:ferredoxin oxidoreductase delta subunit